ncbi:MAG: M20/M25/M40 family metallo-hydrolase [Deltaproteobacteria bacterium]
MLFWTLVAALPAVELAGQVDAARLVADVQALQAPRTRVTGSAGLVEAQSWLEDQLRDLGLSPRRQHLVVEHTFTERAVGATNVLVELGGEGPPLYLVAHLDSKAAHDDEDAAEVKWDPRRDAAPGADDDASGCAALLEVARLLRDRGRRRVVLAWVDAEEMSIMAEDGFMTNLGSEPLAREAEDGAQAISVDMLLRPRPWGGSLRIYEDGREASAELARVLVEASWLVAPRIEVQRRWVPDFTWSDHGSFWAEGLGAVLLIEDDFEHARYHRVTDRFDPEDAFYSSEQLTAATRMLVSAVVLLGG